MTGANGNGTGNGTGPGRRGVHGEGHDDDVPAHVRRDRRRASRGRRDPRSFATRAPVVLVLAAAVVGAVAVDARREPAGGGDGPNSASAARSVEVPTMPVSPGPNGASSTWYCAAGTAIEDGSADHSVTVLNPSDDAVTATITVYPGQLVAAPPAPPAEPADDADDTDGTDGTDETDGTDAGEDTADDAARLEADAGEAEQQQPAPEVVAPAPVDEPRTEAVEVPAGERRTLRLADVVEAPLAAALVEVDAGAVAVEHTVRGDHGVDTAPCSTFAAPAWHFAWGSTARDARDLVVLFNPFPSAATVDAWFVTEEGRRQPVRYQGFPVPAGSVVGVDLGVDVTRAEQVSATFRARSGRVVVERLQQYDGSLGPEGQALTLGTPAAAAEWVFPDGEASAPSPTTPAPEERDDPREDDDALLTTERIVVYNPGEERAEVDVQAVPTGDGVAVPQPFRLSLGAGRYEIIDYGGQERIEPDVPHTTVVRSTNGQPIVAERVLLDQAPASSRSRDDASRPGELTATPGSSLAATRWWMPSVADVGGRAPSVDLVVFNPSADEARTVRVTLAPARPGTAPDDAPTSPEPVEVPPGGRVAVTLDADTVGASGSAVLEADGPVVAERVVRSEDGRRVSAQPAIPSADGATELGAR